MKNKSVRCLPFLLLLLLGACSSKPPLSIVPPSNMHRYLAVLNGNGGYFSFCYPDTGKSVQGPAIGAEWPESVKLHANRLYVVNSMVNQLKSYDARDPFAEPSLVQFDPGTNPVEVAFDGAGSAYVSCYNVSRIAKVDLSTMSVAASLDVPAAQGSNPDGLAVAGGKLYVGLTSFGSGNTVAVVDLASFSLAASSPVTVGENPQTLLETGGLVHAVCTSGYNPDWTPRMAGGVHVIDPATDAIVRTVDLTGSDPAGAAVASNGRVFLTGWEAGLMAYDAASGAVLRGPGDPIARPAGGGLRGMASEGSRLYVCSSMTDEVLVFDTDTYASSGVLSAGSRPGAVEFVP